MSTPDPPAGLGDGLYTVQQPDGFVRFVLAHKSKPVGRVTLPPEQAGSMAANALGGAYEAHVAAASGYAPAIAPKSESTPFVRITGIGLGSCPVPDHVSLVFRVGAARIAFAVPKDKLKEFAQAVQTSEALK
jgi:hypothetical protein